MENMIAKMCALTAVAVFCLTTHSLADGEQAARPLPAFTCMNINPMMYSDKDIVVGYIPDGFNLLERPGILMMGPVWYRYNNDEPWKKREFEMNGVGGYLLQSEDRQCEIVIDSFLNYMPEGESPGIYYPYYPWMLHHRNIIMYDLLTIFEGRDDYRLEDHVTILGGEDVRRRFNADSVFYMNVPVEIIRQRTNTEEYSIFRSDEIIEPLTQDGGIYTHCYKMYLWKAHQAMIEMAWFFTDEGKKREQSYIDKWDRHLWYKER